MLSKKAIREFRPILKNLEAWYRKYEKNQHLSLCFIDNNYFNMFSAGVKSIEITFCSKNGESVALDKEPYNI
jgi:hypothetical protein